MNLDRTLAAVAPTTERTAHAEWTLHLVDPAPDAPAAAVRALSRGIPARVPGSVLGTLIDAGLATDVTVNGTEEQVAWAAASTWAYRTSIPKRGDGAHVRVVFEGIDTIATVKVDGNAVLEADDMFHRWVVDLGRDDAPGKWDLEVELRPAEPVARAAEAVAPLPRADMYEIPFNQVRKMACSFGWDWGPTTMTAGLYREVEVERVGAGRILRTLLSPTWRDGAVLGHGAMLRGSVAVEGAIDRVVVRVSAAGEEPALLQYVASVDSASASFELEVPGASRWDVVGRGEQPLYDVSVEAIGAHGEAIDATARRVGFRSVALVQESDAAGRRFEIHVNGARVWARGFNWIPADVLPERVTRERVRSLVEEAVATGATMLRVWGGGIIESDDFYDACDELGILVWQDYSFACAAYAEDEAQAARVRREVEDAVVRVGHRASLALWCGCNENLWGYEDWGWKEKLNGAGWGAHLYHDVIPGVLASLDPHRPYIPGSPFSPDPDRHPNDETQGTTHHWDTWNQLDYVHFEDKRSRFASEFGWQAPASWETLVTGIGHEPASGADPDLQRLQKHPAGKAALDRAIADHVPHLPTDGRGWYLATQLVQARAIRAAIGRFRSLHDTCSGALWWQLDDCWPAMSWAVLDSAGRRRLAWYAAAEVMAPRGVITTADGDPHGLTLVNDIPEAWEVTGRVRVVDEAGAILHEEALDLTVAADGHRVVRPTVVPAGAAAIVVDAGELRAARWITPDLELAHPDATVAIEAVEVTRGRVDIAVRADTLVRDLVVLAETEPGLGDARADRQLVLLLPGERATLTVRGEGVEALDPSRWAHLLAAGTALRIS